MTHSHDLTAEARQRGALPGRGYTIAHYISRVFHPILLSVISILIVGMLSVVPAKTGAAWSGLTIALQIIPPTIFFTIRLRQGIYSDEDISVRQQRNELYLFGMINIVVVTLILYLLHAPTPLIALILSAGLINIIGFVINLFWKISIHSAGIGSCATVATLYSPPLGAFFWASAFALGWARVRTRNHTPMQVIAGLALSAVCVLAVFAGFRLM